MPRKLVILLSCVAVSSACGSPPLSEWQEASGHRWRELRVRGSGDPGFTEVSARRTGVDFANRLDLEQALDNEHLLVGSGVALGDVDGDDLTDIYLTRLQGPNALYLNRGNWRFEEITEASGLALDDRFSTGAAFADLDGDGDLDLVVTSLGGPDAVFMNDGLGQFSEFEDAGLENGLGSTTVTLADVDGDGDLDLYVTAYKAKSASDVLGMLSRPDLDALDWVGDSLVVAPEYREHFRVEERDGRPMVLEQADPDRLYLNDGTGRFEAVSWTEGAFLDEDGEALVRDLDDFGLAARFYDVNGDGDVDLYVCNDFTDPDQLWLGQGDGTFRATPRMSIRTSSHASMSVDFADIDRDGSVDIFVAEMRTRDRRDRLKHVPFQGRLLKPAGRIDDRPQVQRNTLFLNRGDGSFAEIAEFAEVDASDWSWASMFLDVDLDGFEDLLVANGYSRDTQHGDLVDEISSLQGQATSRELKRLYPPLPNRNVAFRNRGDLTFSDEGDRWGFGTEEDISHGMASADLDGDGDLDVVVNRLGSPALLLRNESEAARIGVRLRGAGPNTYGIGAKVRLLGGAVPVQEREMTAGGLYLSGSAPHMAFAAGASESLELEVVWPGGVVTRVTGVRPDRLYEIREPRPGDALAVEPGRGQNVPEAVLFEDRSELIAHRHPETDFEDFVRQPLLPYMPSRLGPGVTWIDLDRDGDPDLVIPPGAGGRLSYLRNDGGRFVEEMLEDAPSSLDRTAAIGLPGPRGTLLAVGNASYEAATVEEAGTIPPFIVVRPGSTATLPVASNGFSSTGPLAAADLDGDGVLELFLGGRIIKGFYPLPASSALFRQEGNQLVRDPRHDPVLKEIGLVSGAVFSDVDSDGDPDLLLALEWGPIRLLINEQGILVDATDRWGLDRLTGRWNGITTGDFDGDGRMDIVVTGWGRNVRLRPREGRPLLLYHADLDGNGTWDLIPAQAERAGEPPVNLLDYSRLRNAFPSLRTRVPTFEAYGEASVRDVVGSGEIFEASATHYEHLLLLNRGGGFEERALPLEAQLAPSMGVSVGDLDGDGNEDVFLTQNFFPMYLFTPRFDAGLGLFLRGDGEGGFEAVSAAGSGIRIHGDQRGAALSDYDGDGRIDLAVAQNGAATRLFHNVGARPGLRVRLRGPPSNPDGIGAILRVVYDDGMGPAREIHGGSGYWSMDDPVQVLGLRAEPVAVRVRWPGGLETQAPVPSGATTITVRMP